MLNSRLAPALLVALAACSSNAPAAPSPDAGPTRQPDAASTADAGSAVDASSTVAAGSPADAGGAADAGVQGACAAYPVPFVAFSPSTPEQAAAELLTFAPDAHLAWNANLGTLARIDDLNVALPGCADGTSLHPMVRVFLAAHPILFQLDLTEWAVPPPFDCRDVGADPKLFQMRRTVIASHPAFPVDHFQYSVQRVGGVVRIASIAATYLPRGDATFAASLDGCNHLTEDHAEQIAGMTPLEANVTQDGQPPRTVMYEVKPNDRMALDPPDQWGSRVQGGVHLFSGVGFLRITVDPANYTEDLLASDARCPDPETGGFTIGFTLTFDVFTGALDAQDIGCPDADGT